MAEDGRVKIDKFNGNDLKKPDSIDQREWDLQLDQQVLGVIILTPAKNVAYNIVSEEITDEDLVGSSKSSGDRTGEEKVLVFVSKVFLTLGLGGVSCFSLNSGAKGDRTEEETVPVEESLVETVPVEESLVETVLVTPETRRSSRTIRPLQRFSPSVNYMLLTEDGEGVITEKLELSIASTSVDY